MDQPTADPDIDSYQRLVQAFRQQPATPDGRYFATVPVWIVVAEVLLVLILGAAAWFALT